VMLLAVMIVARLPGSRWPFAWFAFEVLLLWGRLRIMHLARPALARGDFRPFYAYTIVATLWCTLLGVGSCVCVMTGEGFLAALAAINVSGVAAGISTRAAAFPRLAIFQILLVGLPYAIGAGLTPVPWFFILALEILMCLAAMSSLAMTHHADSVKMIQAERKNWFLAFHDALTGLPNRKFLRDQLAEVCAGGNGVAKPVFAILCLDLDGFKAVNDTFGHPAGDQLLVVVADRLRLEVRAADTVARIGGDEFVILLLGADEREAARISERIIDVISQPITTGFPAPVTIGVTIGSVQAPADGILGETLLSRADQALYAAKRAGRGIHRTYSETLRPTIADVG
jgi:diguanylate cyclase (GGDEF)-like protein